MKLEKKNPFYHNGFVLSVELSFSDSKPPLLPYHKRSIIRLRRMRKLPSATVISRRVRPFCLFILLSRFPKPPHAEPITTFINWEVSDYRKHNLSHHHSDLPHLPTSYPAGPHKTRQNEIIIIATKSQPCSGLLHEFLNPFSILILVAHLCLCVLIMTLIVVDLFCVGAKGEKGHF